MCHALRGHCLPRTAGTQRHQRICQPSRNGGRGSACPAGVQGCHPSIQHCRDMGQRRGAELPPIQHCRDTGHSQDTELPPIHPCGDPGHCLHSRSTTHPSLQRHRALPRQGHSGTADRAAPPASHCTTRRYHPSGTAGMQEPHACIIHPALHAGHCQPAMPLAEGGPLPTPALHRHRPAALAALQCSQTPPQGRPLALHSPSLLRWQAQHPPSAAQSLGNPTAGASKDRSLCSLQTCCSFPFPPAPDWDTVRTRWVPTRCRCPPNPLQRQGQKCCPPCIAETHTLHTLHRRHRPLETSSQCAHAHGRAVPAALPPPLPCQATCPCLVLCLATSFPVPHSPFWKRTFLIQGPGAPTQLLPSREREGVQPRSPAPTKPSGWMP